MIVKVVKPKADPNAHWLITQKGNVSPRVVPPGAIPPAVRDSVTLTGGFGYFNAEFVENRYTISTPVTGEKW